MKKPFLALLLLPAALLLARAARADDVASQIKLLVDAAGGGTQRVDVTVGQLPSRMNLAPCAKMEPFIPSSTTAGARLWGRTTLGVRCVQGATWQAFLPVHIKVYGEAPVAARAFALGETVTAADVRYEEVELSLYPAGAVADINQVAGKTLGRPVNPGQPLLSGWFRARQVVSQGDTVKVVYAGAGFTVSAEGKALSHAAEGQSVRVAMDSGRTVSGTARDGRVVEMAR